MNSKEKQIEDSTEDQEEMSDFGSCEHCGNKLDRMPNAGWGVGYVCWSCAMKIRGEGEY